VWKKLLESIKKINPSAITIIGGAHISSDLERAFQNFNENLDF
jgi:putative cell wall-binding protein